MSFALSQRLTQPLVWANHLGLGVARLAGQLAQLVFDMLRVTLRGEVRGRDVVQQAYAIGVQSLPLVALASGLSGVVTAQQGGYQFVGALPMYILGSVVAASIILELAPLMTSFVLIGRVGARITAELGTMRVSEQVDALLAFGRDPIAVLGAPRLWASVMVTPLLVAAANAVGVLAGMLAAKHSVGVSYETFLYGVRLYWRNWDIVYSLTKGAAFGFVIPIVAIHMGLSVRGGALGVGRATTTAVVAMMVTVLALDALFPMILLK